MVVVYVLAFLCCFWVFCCSNMVLICTVPCILVVVCGGMVCALVWLHCLMCLGCSKGCCPGMFWLIFGCQCFGLQLALLRGCLVGSVVVESLLALGTSGEC